MIKNNSLRENNSITIASVFFYSPLINPRES